MTKEDTQNLALPFRLLILASFLSFISLFDPLEKKFAFHLQC